MENKLPSARLSEASEKPILFNGAMVRAILSGDKTQTMRPLRKGIRYSVGDVLWVRETWQAIHVAIDPETGYGDDITAAPSIPKDDSNGHWSVAYAATDLAAKDHGFGWRPSIHMPRWASRILLRVVEIECFDRARNITDPQAIAEGYHSAWRDRLKEAGADGPLGTPPKPLHWFCDVYAQIYGREALDQCAYAIRFVKHQEERNGTK